MLYNVTIVIKKINKYFNKRLDATHPSIGIIYQLELTSLFLIL